MDRLIKVIALGLAALFVLSGCGSLAPAPVILPPEQLGTAVVQTAAALLAQTAAAMPPATRTLHPSRTPRPSETPRPTYTPSQTPTPTVTFVLVIPTFSIPRSPTSVHPTAATSRFNSSPGIYSNPVSDECLILDQEPLQYTHFSPAADFDAVWTVMNFSNNTWYEDGVDIVYLDGEKMQKTDDAIDLGVTVKPGESVTVRVDMRAPVDRGSYTAKWGFRVGTEPVFCHVGITISVP